MAEGDAEIQDIPARALRKGFQMPQVIADVGPAPVDRLLGVPHQAEASGTRGGTRPGPQGVTVTVPVMEGWITQKYSKVPGSVKVRENV